MFHLTRKGHSLSCLKVINVKSFISYQANGKFKLLYKLNYKSGWIVYLMEWTLCKIQYVDKTEIALNIRLNTINSSKVYQFADTSENMGMMS